MKKRIPTRKLVTMAALTLALFGVLVTSGIFSNDKKAPLAANSTEREAKCSAANGQREACLEMSADCILLERKTCQGQAGEEAGTDCTASRIECRARNH